jgi:hypothetical protein
VFELAELFNQPQKTVLERAELAMQCVEIIRRKVGQIARPRGGRQENDRGLGTAERILGVSRRDLGRYEKIAGISAEAKEAARRAGLDDRSVGGAWCPTLNGRPRSVPRSAGATRAGIAAPHPVFWGDGGPCQLSVLLLGMMHTSDRI